SPGSGAVLRFSGPASVNGGNSTTFLTVLPANSRPTFVSRPAVMPDVEIGANNFRVLGEYGYFSTNSDYARVKATSGADAELIGESVRITASTGGGGRVKSSTIWAVTSSSG